MKDMASLGFSELIVRRDSETEDQGLSLDHRPNDYDPDKIYMEDVTFEVYGIPKDMDDAAVVNAMSRDMKGVPFVAEIWGTYISCRLMLEDGKDPYTVCEETSAEYEYLMSVLTEDGGPLKGDPNQDVFYIYGIGIADRYSKQGSMLMKRLLKELPFLIKRFMHRAPRIIAYHPAPAKEGWYMESLAHLAATGLLTGKTEREEDIDDEKIELFPGDYHFNEEDQKYIQGRRKFDATYPEELKDRRTFKLYEQNGFKEINDTRLLVLTLTAKDRIHLL